MEVNVIRGNRKVEWVDLGEGFSGDYDPSNPDDQALLRFDVLELTNIHGLFSDSPVMEWEVLDDASYCTQMPADSSDVVLRRGATMIMNATYGKTNIKRICEGLSWIEPGWCVEPQLNG